MGAFSGSTSAWKRRIPRSRAAATRWWRRTLPRPLPCMSSATVIAASARSGSFGLRTKRATPRPTSSFMSCEGTTATRAK